MNFSDHFIERPMGDYTADQTNFDDSFGQDVVPDKNYIVIRLFASATNADVQMLLGLSKQ